MDYKIEFKMKLEKKNGLFKKYIRFVDSDKNILHQAYKTHRNSL